MSVGDADLESFTAVTLAAALRAGDLSPIDVTRAYLTRIERLNPRLGAYIAVAADSALAEAARAEALSPADRAGRPLHGVPFAVKDLFHTAGVATTAGSLVLRDFVPAEDATAVARIRRAGGVLLGKLNLTEFAASPDDGYPYGEPRNPWDQTRVPGASSGGSAVAVAASLAALTLGSDTGGSSRGPASHCGIVGMRPTWGRVSRHGMVPSSWSMDTPGVMTRTVEDCAVLLGVIAGADANDTHASGRPVAAYRSALTASVRGKRAVIIDEWIDPATTDPEVVAAVNEAARVLTGLGLTIEHLSWPRCNEAAVMFGVISQSDASFVNREWLRDRPGAYGTHFRVRMLAASLITAGALQKAQRLRARLRAEWRALFDRWDVILSPTISRPAEPIARVGAVRTKAEAERAFGFPRIQRHVAALAGTPAISVPCGFSREGLPIGLQIMTKAWADEEALAVAASYQRATSWHERRPPLG